MHQTLVDRFTALSYRQDLPALRARKQGIRMRHLTRTLTLLPIVAGAISTILYLAQGGFAGGHYRLDSVIVLLGLPSILLLDLLLPVSISLPDILLIVWLPALMNAPLFYVFARVLSSLRKTEG